MRHTAREGKLARSSGLRATLTDMTANPADFVTNPATRRPCDPR